MITALEFVQKTREVAEREAARAYTAPGEYQICVYWYESCPSCLFGQVFHELGIGEEALLDWKPRIRLVLRHLAKRGLIEAVPVEWACWAGHIQLKQDDGMPWGKCVEAADAEWPGVPA